jgi:hypothetical protein
MIMLARLMHEVWRYGVSAIKRFWCLNALF